MTYLKQPLFIFLFVAITSLTACGVDETKEIATVHNPEIVAVAFFDALYNERNVEKASSVCSPKLRRLIFHYRSTEAIGRHLFNMSYDMVTVRPDDSGIKIREQFKGNANVTVYFDGYYNDKRIKEVKRLALVQIDGRWFIDELLKDPF